MCDFILLNPGCKKGQWLPLKEVDDQTTAPQFSPEKDEHKIIKVNYLNSLK